MGNWIREGSRVRVLPAKPDGTPHPHAGFEGYVAEFLGVNQASPGSARALIRILDGPEPARKIAGNFISVNLISLEKL